MYCFCTYDFSFTLGWQENYMAMVCTNIACNEFTSTGNRASICNASRKTWDLELYATFQYGNQRGRKQLSRPLKKRLLNKKHSTYY